jgi:hypothetical protein
MPEKITREMIRDYLNDALPDAELTAVEKAVRESPKLQELAREIREEIDRGEHSVGAVWRRERLSCPGRDHLGGFLLQALDPDLLDYVEFHVKVVGCPYCQANLEDLAKRQAEADGAVKKRRQRILKSSAGVLKHATGR